MVNCPSSGTKVILEGIEQNSLLRAFSKAYGIVVDASENDTCIQVGRKEMK